MQVRTSLHEGAEAAVGSLPFLEHLPLRTFTTDRYGFRYTPPVTSGPVETVVFRGFSFVFGYGLGDEQTLAAQLARYLHRNVYNAARFKGDPESPRDFDRTVARVGAAPKTVVYVALEAENESTTAFEPNLLRRVLWFSKVTVLSWIKVAPVLPAQKHIKRAMLGNAVLYRSYQDTVRILPLPDGTEMVVRHGYVGDLQVDFPASVIEQRASYIARWDRHVKERGGRMIALLVPSRLSVYGPHLGLKSPADPLLHRLARALAARGVHAVDALALLEKSAQQDLATGNLAYLREDEHWNAEGVRRIAAAAAQEILTQ
jgi:hypothetical protein